MQEANPTGDAGVSTLSRLESFLAASEGESTPQQPAQAAEPKEPEQSAPEPEVEQQPESDASGQEEEPQISLSDLAKYLGVDETTLDVDDDGGVKVKTKIDGKEGAAKFQDLLKSYQLQGHIDNKAREAAELQKTLQERMSQFETYAKDQAERLNTLAGIAQQELMADASQIDWATLSRTDPAEYVAKQHDFQQRQARVNQLLTAAQQQKQQADQANLAKQQQTLQSEMNRLPALIPEWADETVREAEKAELRNWAKSQGFTDEMLGGLVRAEMVASLRKAMLFDKGKTTAAITEKKVRTAPKLVKPGQSVDQKTREGENIRGLKDSIRKSGGKTGIAEYLLATGKV